MPAETPHRGRVLSYERALSTARRLFAEQGHLDMEELADALAVSRATLYRVVGGRDRLLGDVLHSLAERTLQMAIDETRSTGVERMIDIARNFNRHVVGFEPLRKFLHAEPDTAHRVLFTSAGGVHQRNVEAWKALFEEAQAAGEVTLPFDSHNAAYLFVRIGESILYSDLFAGREPDVDLCAAVQRAILRID